MKIPTQAIDIIKKWEGFRAETYLDSVGVPTIGYGTTARAGVGIVPVPGMVISEKQATSYLRKAVEKFADSIQPHITAPINDNEWSAFLSLAYNIGPGAFRTSTALKRFNAGDKAGSAEALTWFNKADGRTLTGLTRRRADEKALFLRPIRRQSFFARFKAWWADVISMIQNT